MKKDLVIVGGGFAGIATYRSLPRSVYQHYRITIIDKHNYFLFTPLLHEVATGSLEAQHVVESYEQILRPGDRIIESEVQGFDFENQMIRFNEREPMSYDIAVVALGSTTNFFGTPGAQEHSFLLKDLGDAQKLRNHFIDMFKRASEVDSETEQKEILSTLIIGGGPTGVELAAETAELFFHTFKNYYEGTMDISHASLTLVNAGESLLSPFSPASQYYAQKILREKGVTVLNKTFVKEVYEDSVLTGSDTTIKANTIVWAAGVDVQALETSSHLERKKNRVSVTNTLQLEHHDNVFFLGDMASVSGTGERGLPMLAQVAKQQGECTGKNIARLIDDQPLHKFVFKRKGSLASLGRFQAIAEINGINFYGPLAWFIWRTVYLINFNSWSKRCKIMVDWTINLFSKRDISKI